MSVQHSHEAAVKNIGDIGASAGSALVVVSHWSEVLTPIVALLVGLLTLIWWAVRLWDRFRPEGEKLP